MYQQDTNKCTNDKMYSHIIKTLNLELNQFLLIERTNNIKFGKPHIDTP